MTLADCESRHEDEEARLVSAVARRDSAAFRVLVERHAGAIHALAYRMLGDRHEAEDVVQEALLRLWDGADRFQPRGGGVPGWLRRVATNLCIDRVRKAGRLSDAPVPDRADPALSADTLIDEARTSERARAALQALPDRQRAAIVLTYYEQLSNAAAAEILGLKIKAFESLLVRARDAARDLGRQSYWDRRGRMTDRRPDPMDELLSGLDVPPLSAGFTDRLVAEAQRADRVSAPAFSSSHRPRARRWTRRGAWTAVLAINLVLASAVAAALGSGAIRAPHLIAAARHVVERLTHRGDAAPPHREPTYSRAHALVSPARQPAPRLPAIIPAPIAQFAPAMRAPVDERPQPAPRVHPRGEAFRIARPVRMRPAPMMLRPARRQPPEAGMASRRFGAAGMPFERRRFAPGAGRRSGGPSFYGPRFERPRAGPPRFRGGPRFGAPRRGGFRGAWRGRLGGPRRRF